MSWDILKDPLGFLKISPPQISDPKLLMNWFLDNSIWIVSFALALYVVAWFLYTAYKGRLEQ
jgi:heme/copper-type cytochrome/quinol oxidase subunit 2